MKEKLKPSNSDIEQYQEAVEGNIENPYLSPTFKLWVMGTIFVLTFFHFFALILFPVSKAISKEFILGFSLALIAYLWAQELREKERLRRINEALVLSQKKLKEAEVNAMASLVLLEEAKDPFVKGHSLRVAHISAAIASVMELSGDTVEIIKRAGLLHDLGKLIIKYDILQKRDKLTPEEWEIIKKHPQSAVDILKPLKFLFLEKKIIFHHHERMDGKGYPAGLEGKDIPFESKIIAVADTFDAMNCATPYRDAFPKDYIVEELKKVSGTQLEGSLVARFLQLLEKNPQLWEKDVDKF